MTDLNLRALVREVLGDTDLAEPSAVAEETFRRLTRGQYAAALRQALREYARQVLKNQPAHVDGDTSPDRSWKRDAIRSLIGGFREFYSTPDGWKHLRDCTRDDLLYAADERRRKAAENVAEAERLEKLAARLSDGQTVGDLDEFDADAA